MQYLKGRNDDRIFPSAINRLPDLDTVIFRGEDNLPGTFNFSILYNAGGSADHQQRDDLAKKIKFDDPINIQFTSVSWPQKPPAVLD